MIVSQQGGERRAGRRRGRARPRPHHAAAMAAARCPGPAVDDAPRPPDASYEVRDRHQGEHERTERLRRDRGTERVRRCKSRSRFPRRARWPLRTPAASHRVRWRPVRRRIRQAARRTSSARYAACRAAARDVGGRIEDDIPWPVTRRGNRDMRCEHRPYWMPKTGRSQWRVAVAITAARARKSRSRWRARHPVQQRDAGRGQADRRPNADRDRLPSSVRPRPQPGILQ
jgi:hypothetical protein